MDAGWLTSLPLLLNLVSVASTGYIIRQLGETGWGTLVTALGLSGATTILSNLGLRALYTRAVAGASDSDTGRLMTEQLGLRTILGTVAAAIAITAAVLLHPDDRAVILCTAIQAVAVIITITWSVMADVLNAREQFGRNARIAFVAGLCLTGVSVVAAALGGGPVAIAATYLTGPAVSLSLLWVAMRRMGLSFRVGGVPWRRYRELLGEARALAANDVVTVLQNRAAGVWAPLLFSKGLIGVNDSGTLPYHRLWQVGDGIATAYFPTMATAHKRGDEGLLRHQVGEMLTLLLVATVPLAICTWYGAPYLAALLFPQPSQASSVELTIFVARVTAFAIPVTALGTAIRYSMQAAGLHSRNAKDQMIGTTISAVLMLSLALAIGIKGLPIGILLGSMITRTTQQRSFNRRFEGILAEVRWKRGVLGLVSLAVALELTIGTAATPGLLAAVAWGGGLGLAYLGYLVFSGVVGKLSA